MYRLSIFFISLFSFIGMSVIPAFAVVPQGDTGSWMVSIDSIIPSDTSATVHGTLYNGINPAGANINITTRHITNASATQLQNGSQTHGVTDSSGKFAITLNTLIPSTSYKVNATASAPQGTLATSQQETFTTNQGSGGTSDVHITYNGQPTATKTTLTLKFKAIGLSSQTTATIQLERNGTIIKTNTISQIIPDASNVATFQTTFTGLTAATAYTGQITLGNGLVVGFGPDSTANTNGTPPTQSPIHVYISENDAVITSTTFSITGFVTGDSATTTSIKGLASADGANYGISSAVAYTGAPDTVGSVFTASFSGLSPSTSYAYKIRDTTNDKDLSPVYYFTTGSASGGVGSTGSDGTWFDLNANYQSAITQTNNCHEKDGEYCMLAPIPFPGIVGGKLGLTPDTTGSSGVSNFINGIIQFAIAFAGLLAVIMIIAGGVLYATSEAMGGKAQAKTMITNAIFGLLLALCSYLILKTINPALVDLKLDIAKHEVVVTEVDDAGNTLTISYSDKSGECPKDCIKLKGAGGTDLPYKSGIGDQVEKTLKPKLQSLFSASNSIASWQVTEAWQPTRTHNAHCHKVGTCVDINLTTSDKADPAVDKVKKIVTSAISAGLCPVFETASSTMYAKMKNGGVPTKNLLLYPNITAPHFSIYGGNCK